VTWQTLYQHNTPVSGTAYPAAAGSNPGYVADSTNSSVTVSVPSNTSGNMSYFITSITNNANLNLQPGDYRFVTIERTDSYPGTLYLEKVEIGENK